MATYISIPNMSRWIFLLLILICDITFAVDRGNFKTCDQSSFCKRNRALNPHQSSYELLINTLKIYPTRLEGEILNIKSGVLYRMKVFSLADNTVRLKIEELNPLRPRFSADGALTKEPEQQNLEVQNRDAEGLTFTFQNNKVVIHAKPFRIDFYIGEELVMIANARGLFKFEHTRNKPQLKEEEAQNENPENPDEVKEQVPEENEDGMWEETFKSHRDSKPFGPTSVGMDFSFIGMNHVYGIPEHADSFALKSTVNTDPYRLYNLDVFEYELNNPMSLYGAAPYMIGHNEHNTVGLFWLNPSETWIDIVSGSEQNMMLTIMDFVKGQTRSPQMDTHWFSESGIIDVFFLLGPSAKDTFRQYGRLTGTTPLPLYSALGYHQCRWNYLDQDDVRSVDAGFDEHDLPYDFIWLDIEYTDGKRYFTWDKPKFSQPKDMMNNLTAKGHKMVLIIDPHIKRASGYHVHEDATHKGYYVKNKEGNDYEGWSWPGSSSFLDFLNPEVRDYWSSNYALDKFEGTTLSTHIWNDMNEPSVFNGPEVTMHKDAVHFGGWEHREIHNMYSFYSVIGTYDGLMKRGDGKHRPFILTRGFFSGIQRYAAVWNGDNMANWDHLRITIPMLLSMSVAGVSFCGSDVGGFFGNPDSELFVRWYQAATYHPFFRSHAHIETRRREPWVYDDGTKKLIREALRRRYALLPYLYTTFYENDKTAIPPMRPIWLEFPNDPNTFGIEDSHMLGNALLIHPVVYSNIQQVDVYLPGDGVWYDAESFVRHDKLGKVTIPVTLEKVPVFQLGGTIVPRKDRIRRSSILAPDDPYTLYVALDKKGTFANGTLYIDDGASFDYKQDKFLFVLMTYQNNKLTSRLSAGGKYKTKSWLERVVILGQPNRPTKIELESPKMDKKLLDFSYDAVKQVLTLRKPGVNIAEPWSVTFTF